VTAESEQGECDEGLGRAKPKCDAGEQPDLCVRRLDQPLGEPVVQCGVDGRPVFDDFATEFDEGWNTTTSGPADPGIERLFAGLALDDEDVAQALFRQVGAVKAGVGLGDPLEPGSLMFGEVLGVLPQGVAGPFDRGRIAVGRVPPTGGCIGAVPTARFVPCGAAHDVEGLGCPRHHVKGVRALHRLGTGTSDDMGDPGRRIRRDVGDLCGPVRSEQVEEALQGRLVTASCGPYESARVVVNHDSQVSVSPLIGDLVDPDPSQARQAIHPGVDVTRDSRHDRPDAAPGDPHQLGDGALGALHGQPGDGVVEGSGVPGPVAGPGHLTHGRSMDGAVHPGSIGLEEAAQLTDVKGSPAPPALAPVVEATASSAVSAPARCPFRRSYRHDDCPCYLVDFDPLDDRARQPQQPLPYARVPHPVCPPRFGPSDSPKRRSKRGAHAERATQTPTDQSGEPHLFDHRLVRVDC
jgi:hypothetical protein